MQFRVARQNLNGGVGTTGNERLEQALDRFTAGRIRVQDTNMTRRTGAGQSSGKEGKAFLFRLSDNDGDGMPDWYERSFGTEKKQRGGRRKRHILICLCATNVQESNGVQIQKWMTLKETAISDGAEINRLTR